MSHPLLAMGLAFVAASPLAAQAATYVTPVGATPSLPYLELEHEQTTGWVSNESERTGIVASLYIEVPNADSLRLLFGEVELAGGTLRVVSLKDEAVQTLDARGLEQWSHSSAWFNGGTLLLDLILAPGAGPAIVTIDSLEVGVPPNVTQSQCGPTDDRVPSSDPRVARLLPSGCTAWMIDDCSKCFLSAGHCGSSNNMVEFNVPFSNSNGSWNHPPPSDQYPIDSASVQSQNSFGSDWLYFGTFANSTSGLSAFKAQGSAFALVSPPPTSGNNIRITGHGTDNTPNGTFNQIQQTHSGPFTGIGTTLTYKVDTEGGNSGSPVIWEEEDVAIGIHTNAGCSTSGSGSNNGTNINNANLQAALANPLGVCASGGFGGPFEDLGNSSTLFPFGTPPEVKGCGTLETGTTYAVVLSLPQNLVLISPTSTASVLVAGFSELNLPISGGVLVPSLDIVTSLPVATDGSDSSVTLAGTWNLPSGTSVNLQFWTPVTTGFGSGFVVSNGLKMTTP